MSKSMKGLKIVMSVRLCEGSIGTLTSETGERPKAGSEDSTDSENGAGSEEAKALPHHLKGTHRLLNKSTQQSGSKGEASVIEEFEPGLSWARGPGLQQDGRE